jgi:hypothetical protein
MSFCIVSSIPACLPPMTGVRNTCRVRHENEDAPTGLRAERLPRRVMYEYAWRREVLCATWHDMLVGSCAQNRRRQGPSRTLPACIQAPGRKDVGP